MGSQGVQHPPGGGQDRGDLPQLWGAGPDQPHGGAHHLHLGRGGRAHGLLLHHYQGGRLCRGDAEGGGRLQGVRLLQRLVSSSKRNYCCGTNPGVLTSDCPSDMDVKKPSAKAEEKKEKEKKVANAM